MSNKFFHLKSTFSTVWTLNFIEVITKQLSTMRH